LTTGRRSERFAQRRWPQWPEEAFVQVGDFFQMSLELAARRGFTQVILAVFFGKALKMAQGAPHTHAARSELSLDALAEWAQELCSDAAMAHKIRACHTAREAFELLAPAYPALVAEVGRRIVAAASRFTGPEVKVWNVIFDYEGNVAFDSEKQF
jgi:cobalt-precorrin-5B (C1)-methyltransferase